MVSEQVKEGVESSIGLASSPETTQAVDNKCMVYPLLTGRFKVKG